MRRRVCDEPIGVEVRDDRPVRFRRGDRDYEVITFLKLLTLLRPSDGIDVQLWQVRARCGTAPARTYELRRDHERWRLAAVWC